MDFKTNAGTQVIRLTNGVALYGTTTNSSNGILQLATHTTSTGGIGFGTDQSLFRGTANDLVFKGSSGRNLYLYSDATFVGLVDAAGTAGRGIIMTTTSTILTTGAGAVALTLDSSQFMIKSTGANGQSLNIKYLTELTTIAAAATTDTTIQMPAGAIVLSVSVRVTVVIPTAATFTVGDSGSAARFSTAAVSTAANSTDAGTKAGAYYNASALSVRITPNLTPADNTGRVRVTIAYVDVTVPTS